MKKYCHVYNNVVTEIIPEFDEVFPDIPIEERYTKEFLDNCIVIDEDVIVYSGYIYEDGAFKEPPIEPIPEHPQAANRPPTEEELIEIKLAHNTTETLDLITALNEQQKLEQAKSNAEMIELIMSIQQGGTK